MILSIIVSSVCLALDNPLNDPESNLSQNLKKVEVLSTIIFVLEAVAKMITYGLWDCGSKSYFRNEWNTLDFFVVSLTLVSYMIGESGTNLSMLKALRLIKVLRPLRALSKNEGLKISINALRIAFPEIVQIIIMSLIFYFIFGVIGINYFKGTFYDCTEPYPHLRLNQKWDCLNLGGTWQNSYLNFDNIFEAIATLFVISNSVQWAPIMFRACKARGADWVPSDDSTL